MTKLISKLLKFQEAVNSIKKDGNNPHFKSTYATLPNILSEVKPLLTSFNLVITQPINDKGVGTIIQCAESGEAIESFIPLPQSLNPQQLGSAITYFRRYTLASLLSLEIEDDDANEASLPTKPVTDNKQEKKVSKWLNKGTAEYNSFIELLKSKKITIEQIKQEYLLSRQMESELKTI